MELKFDATKIKKVPITQIQPNPWNPKEKDTPEYKKVVKSIQVNGLRDAILVRELEKDKYEIIDGQQRWTAASEIGYKEVYIYNEGTVTDQLAKELTIWYQQQVPFDKISEAKLVRDLLLEYDDAETLPYTDEEIKEMKALAEFDFDQFKDEDPDTGEEVQKLILKLSPGEMKEALAALNHAHVSQEEAFMDLIRNGEVREA